MTAEATASSDDETRTALAAATISGENQQEQDQQQQQYPDLSLNDIIDGDNGRGIPSVKFVSEDVGMFVDGIFGGSQDNTGGAATVSAELLIGAFSQLHAKYKSSEASLQGKQENLKQKIPELQKSIAAIQMLLVKTTQQQQQQDDNAQPISIRYALSDNIYAKAQLVPPAKANAPNVVYLWLGANVMLEYQYDEALTFLRNNHAKAERDLATISNDLSFVRDQIVTSEVNMSRIFNWDVRRRRQQTTTTTTTTTTSSSGAPMQL